MNSADTDTIRRGVACDARDSDAQLTRRASQATPLQFLRTLTLTLTLSSVATLSAATLESKNPFLPAGYGEKSSEPPIPVVQNDGPIARELEFRGLAELRGIKQFSIFNKSEQRSYWLKENEMEDGIVVRGYDANSRSITITKSGRSERLNIMSATQAPLPVASSVTIAAPKAPPAVSPPNLRNTNNADANRNRVVPRRRVILPKK